MRPVCRVRGAARVGVATDSDGGKAVHEIRAGADEVRCLGAYGQSNNTRLVGSHPGRRIEMKGLKALGIGFGVAGLLFAVPAAAIALLLTVGHDNQSTTANTTMPGMSS